MYFEILKNHKIIKRGDDILNDPVWDNELMYIPSTVIRLPITYHELITGRDEMKIFKDDQCFWGIVMKIEEDKATETIDVYLEHIVYEWTFRQISVNNAIKDKNINIVYKGAKTETDGEKSISASPFSMLLEEVGTFTDEKYISRAGASAWTASGETLDITVSSEVEDKAGEYDVTFTADGLSVTVTATVIENENKSEQDDYVLTASDFSMFTDEVGSLTAEDYIQRANATITPAIDLNVDYSDVRAVSGTYRVEFSATYEKEVEGEMEEQTISVSVTAIVEGESDADPTIADNIADIYADMNFAYHGWRLNMSEEAEDTTIDYVYSRQNKLEALTKTMELTKDLFWRVRFVNEKVIDISAFGEKKEYIISTKPAGKKNIPIMSEPKITHEYEHVINVATVYSEKSDSGMSSMTLREIYENPGLQDEGFPVVILRANVNNERDYHKYIEQYPELGPNNEYEYAIIDEESVALEGGHIIEGTFAFNDLAPFSVTDDDGEIKEITNEDRIKAATTVYHAGERKLIASRRRYYIDQETQILPNDINPGDMVRYMYDNQVLILKACSKYLKHILSYDDWFYVTRCRYDVVPSVTLEKYLRIDRDITEE